MRGHLGTHSLAKKMLELNEETSESHLEYEETPLAICRHVSVNDSQPKVQQHACHVAAQASRIWATDPDFLFQVMSSPMNLPASHQLFQMFQQLLWLASVLSR